MEEFFKDIAVMGAGISSAVQVLKGYFSLGDKVLFKIKSKSVSYSFAIAIVLTLIVSVLGNKFQYGIYADADLPNTLWIGFNILLVSLGVHEAIFRHKK